MVYAEFWEARDMAQASVGTWFKEPCGWVISSLPNIVKFIMFSLVFVLLRWLDKREDYVLSCSHTFLLS